MDDSKEQSVKHEQEMASSAGSESPSSNDTDDSSTDDSEDDASDDQSSQSDSSTNSSNDSVSTKSSTTRAPHNAGENRIRDESDQQIKDDDDDDDDDDEQDQHNDDKSSLPSSNKPCRRINKSKDDFKKLYDIYPDALRRSSRSRKEPDRFQADAYDESDDSDSLKTTRRRRKRKDSDEWSENRVSSGDDHDPQNDQHNDWQDSDDCLPSKSYKSRSSRRIRSRTYTSNKKDIHSASDTDGEDDSDEESDHRSRNTGRKKTSRRSVNPVSYKEESDYTDDDDLMPEQTSHMNNDDSIHEAHMHEEDEGEMIEKVLEHRMGRPGATGPKTASYQMDEHGDPNASASEEEKTEQQFLIKWKGWSYIHCTWESRQSLEEQKAKSVKKIEQYLKRDEEIKLWKQTASPEDIDYYEGQEELNYQLRQLHLNVERIIAHQAPKDNSSGQPEYFCKWEGLPYSECTWEDGTLIEKRFHSKVSDYYQRDQSENIPSRSCRVLKQRPKFVPMKSQPSFIGGKDQLKLRDYQLDGLNWLAQSWSRCNSAILADEMGLGKTIQTISFLNYLYHEHNLFGPFLLVVPLSTLTAWQKEFDTWAPDMNVVVFVGDATSRHMIHEYEWSHRHNNQIKFNVLLTTYEILLREKQCLSAVPWAVLGVDEAHRLKNDESFLYKYLSVFDTNYRLLITGTPLQNSLRELWALLHFIMPSRFDSWESFEAEHKDSYQKGFSKLHSQLQQFLLRRVKKDVEKSLPAKVEQILRVDMTSIQKQFYKWILTKNYKALSKGVKGSISSFTNIVMELKKCCNHASLVRSFDDEYAHLDPLQRLIRGSGKLLLLDKLLCRLKETGHRVLIFSQMVRMLDLLGEYLSLRRFQYQRLDGSIRGEFRKQALEHFNAEGSQDFCFLLSTRAGGLGINLATADTVIIFDSDWNPQNDLQAQARAHRIGQKNQVNIYRLVTKGSVEEDIIERAKRKMVLDHLVIQRMDTSGRTIINRNSNTALHDQTNKSNNATPFNKEELSAILKFGAEDLFKETGENGDQEEPQCDIDEILKRAETRDDDDSPQTLGDELLNSFKVASVNFNEEEDVQAVSSGKEWHEIIPESERVKFEQDERHKEQMEMIMLPRSRNKSKMIGGNRSDSGDEYDPNAKNADSPGSDDSDSERPRRRGRPKSCVKESIKGFSEQELRRFIKSFKKFARPLNRLESIAIDAELQEKPLPDLQKLAVQIQEHCQMAMSESEKQKEKGTVSKNCRGPTFKFGGVSVFARTILTNQKELEPLDLMLPNNAEERKKWILTGIKVRTAEWHCPWTIEDDSRLLVGVYEYGLGSWESIKMDPSLKLTDKILPDGETTPQAKHLTKRVECLLKLMKRHLDSQKIKLDHHLSKAKSNKKDSIMANKDNKSRTSQDKMVDSKKKKANLHNNNNDDDKHRKKHNHKKDKKKDRRNKKEKKKQKPTDSIAPGLVDELSDQVFNECKEQMRAVKKSIKTLNKIDDELLNKKQRKEVFYNLVATIGAHIDVCLKVHQHDSVKMKEWRNNLWTFVSKFTEYPAKKLYKFYRRVKLKPSNTKSSNDHHSAIGSNLATGLSQHDQSSLAARNSHQQHYQRNAGTINQYNRKTDGQYKDNARYHQHNDSDRQSSMKRDYYSHPGNSPQTKFVKHSHHSSRNDYSKSDYSSTPLNYHACSASTLPGYWSSKHDGYRINNSSYDNNRYHSNKNYYPNRMGPDHRPMDRYERRGSFNHMQYNHQNSNRNPIPAPISNYLNNGTGQPINHTSGLLPTPPCSSSSEPSAKPH